MIRIADMSPDWDEIWTAQEAEEELRNEGHHGFNFKGPGWYITKDETILVSPYSDPVENPWAHVWPADQRFLFQVYIKRNPADVFSAIVNAPVRQDERQG